jgi:hypothetical protein
LGFLNLSANEKSWFFHFLLSAKPIMAPIMKNPRTIAHKMPKIDAILKKNCCVEAHQLQNGLLLTSRIFAFVYLHWVYCVRNPVFDVV